MFDMEAGFLNICDNLNITDKLAILSDAAKYDVACTSSGTERSNNGRGIGSAAACGICHSFASDGRCISLLKMLMSNECIYDCRYCINRSSNDVVRTSFTPDEICTLTMEFYRRNYIEGLFLSSGIVKNPTYTMGLLYQVVYRLRTEYNFGGYIHVKAIPGADRSVIEMTGWYADRMSVNLELATTDGLKSLAPNKSRHNILTPMRQIQNGIKDNVLRLNDNHVAYGNGITFKGYCGTGESLAERNVVNYGVMRPEHDNARFVPAGQSTQMIIGATPENDYQLVTVAEALYKNYGLKRVFYSAFVNVNNDSALPSTEAGPPLLREHRLYQADWLLRFYGFKASDLLSEDRPDFNVFIDPKCDWAVRHLEQFPVEINRAGYYTLLKVPGIGTNSARRIVNARKSARLDFEDIRKMGVVLKRAVYFITCSGRMMYQGIRINEDFIVSNLADADMNIRRRIGNLTYKQISFFDDDTYADIMPEGFMQNNSYGVISGQI